MIGRLETRTTRLAERGGAFRAAAQFVRRRWPLLLGATALALFAAALVLVVVTPLYTATAQLLIETRGEGAIDADAILTRPPLDKLMMKSQIAVIRSPALLRRVVERETLVDDPELGAGTLARRRAVADPIDATVERLKGALAVTLLRNSHVIQIAVTSADPTRAARLADAIADAYLVDALDTRLEAARRASSWLAERQAALQSRARASEEALARFRAEIASMAQDAKIAPEQLARLARRAADARAEAAERKARLELLERIESRGGNAAQLPGAGGALAELRRRAADLTRREAELRSRYGGTHPSLVALRAEIAEVDRAMEAETRRLSVGARRELELAEAAREAAEATLRELSAADERVRSQAIALGELERAAAADGALLETILGRARLVQERSKLEQSKFEPREARIISPALAPSAPSWPDNGRTMLVAFTLGLFLGLGAAYASEMADTGFTTLPQVEAGLGLPLLASIFETDLRVASEGAASTLADHLRAEPFSRASDAFHALRGAIQMTNVDDPPKTLQITSALPGEGATTIAAALAVSAAQSGLRTLLVDADPRRRTVSLGLSAGKRPGLVELLLGSARPSAAIFRDEAHGIWVLPAGGETQNATDLLDSEKMRALVAALRRGFDLVIFDTPPIGPVLDPLVVAGLVDETLLVIRWAATPRETVAHAIERLPRRGKIAGVVFNRVIEAAARKYRQDAYFRHLGGGTS